MISDKLFDNVTLGLNKALSYRVERQNVISSNIANLNTPNYKAKELDFESMLKDVMEDSPILNHDKRHQSVMKDSLFDSLDASVREISDAPTANDLNTVNMEQEIAKMVENQILYRGSQELLNRKLALLKYAISEGGLR